MGDWTPTPTSAAAGARPVPDGRAPHPVAVGVDVGGSKTRLRATAGGRVLADLTVPSAGVLAAGYEATAAALVELVQQAIGTHGVPGAVAVGAHGCESPAQSAELRGHLVDRLPVPTVVVNDAELLLPAAGLTTGIAVVAGTGSVAVGRTTAGVSVQCGGWGWLLGDEGSAAGIVREACRSALARTDRGLADDQLSTDLQASFGVRSVSDLPAAIARAGSAAGWGRHAPVVFGAAHDGCPSAVRVVEHAGDALAALVTTLGERGCNTDTVVVAGGVFVAQPVLQQAFTGSLVRRGVAARVVVLEEPPVAGAVTLAVGLLRDADCALGPH